MQAQGSRYELVHHFAQGATADLWIARRHGAAKFVRQCIVKLLLPEVSEQPARVEAFLAEARVAALMQHRNVVQVVDLGQLEGRHFVAVELVDGPDVAGLLARAIAKKIRIPAELAVWIAASTAAGLHYAHELQDPATGEPLHLVHGALVPNSIVASRFGSVHLVGFGRQATTNTSVEPRAQPWVAPEVVAGQRFDRRADVFGIGAILYGLLTGKPPSKHTAPLPPSALGGPPDSRLDNLILRCLAADPASRPADAATLNAELSRWLYQRTTDARDQLARFVSEHALDLCPTNRSVAEQSGPEFALTELPDDAIESLAHNLTRPPSSLVGGQRTLARIADHLGSGKRLVCLRGPAGIGKSRLALESAWRVVEAGEVALRVELHTITTVMGACSEIADVMGCSVAGSSSDGAAVAAVAVALAANAPLLIVLDGVDKFAERAPAMLEAILEATSDVRLLVTSRTRIKSPSCTGVVVQPLVVPGLGKAAMQADAARLFVARATRAKPDFTASSQNEATIARIVSQLGGIPLAIELAAAHVGELALDELLERIKQGIDGLATKKRGRHEALRGAIGWSWTMLEGWERTALIQVSVFRGGFDLAGAEAVVRVDGAPKDVSMIIADLADRSLVRIVTGEGPAARYGLFDSIRSYVAEQGDAKPLLAAAEEAHAEHVLSWAREQHKIAWTHDGPDAIDAMSEQRENLVAIHERSVTRRPLRPTDVDRALLVPVLLYPCTVERGPQALLTALFSSAIDAANLLNDLQQTQLDQAIWVRAMALHADMIANTGRASEGAALAQKAVQRGKKCGDLGALALAHYSAAITLRLSDHMDDAVKAAQTARATAQGAGDLAIEAQALNVIGGVFYDLGEREMAAGCFHASLAAARQIGHYMQVARCTGNLGCVYADRGDVERAVPYFHESLGDARQQKNRRGEGVIHSYLGIVAQERGNFGLAKVHYKRGLELLEQVGDTHRKAYVEGLFSWMLAETGDLKRAERILRRIIDEFVARGDWRLRAMYLATLAFCRARAGDAATAANLRTLAYKLAARQSDPSAIGVLDVFGAGCDLVQSASAKNTTQAIEALGSVQRPRPGDDKHPDGKPPLTLISSEVRTALRILAANGVDQARQKPELPGSSQVGTA